MALCNALRDASAFSAHPRPCSGSAGLMVLSTLASPGKHPNAHWRLFVGHGQTRSARAPPACWFFPRRRLRKPSLEPEHLSGLLNSFDLALVKLVFHPYQQAAAHLACTRPPDCLMNSSSQTPVHAASEPKSPSASSFRHHSLMFRHHGPSSP
jgi:hypothetical protein